MPLDGASFSWVPRSLSLCLAAPFAGVASWPLSPSQDLILNLADLYQAPPPWM